MKKIITVNVIMMVLLVGCSKFNETEKDEQQENTVIEVTNVLDENTSVVADELNIPWSIDKKDDTFYLSERTGSIVKIENGEVERQKVELEKDLATASEAGLLGFVLAPDFQQSNRAYVYYTYKDDTGQFNRIVTVQQQGDIWKEERLLLDKIPSGSYHHGGRLKISPDGKLYATTGDAAQKPIAQDLNSLGGKILRMNLDGSIPADNPFPNSYIYSYGHRNPQGLTWSDVGAMYASEHGNNANDEINLIEAGQNYGWPTIEGTQQQQGLKTPLFTSGSDTTWAPSGMDYVDGKLYVAALRGQAVIEFNLTTGSHRNVVTNIGRIRDIFIDGDQLYFISNNTDGRGDALENDDKLYQLNLSQLN